MMRHLSIRLTLMFAACAAAVFLLGGWALYHMLNEGLMDQVRSGMRQQGGRVEAVVQQMQTEAQWRSSLTPSFKMIEAERSDVRLWVVSGWPEFRYGSPRPDIEALARSGGFGELVEPSHPCKFLTWTRTIPAYGDRPEVTLVLVKDPLDFLETLARIRGGLIGLALLGVLAVAMLGFGIARVGLRPLERLSRQAQNLDPQHPQQRLALRPMPAELDNLTVSFNGALAGLETAYRQLEAFNADVAHELRTPLTNLIGQTQVVLTRERSAADLEDVLRSNLEELERLKAIVNDMLFLARADQGAVASRHASTSIAHEVRAVADYMDVLFDESGVRLRIDGDEQASVETALLRRALGNLLQNAIEHSTAGDEIVVGIARVGKQVCVSVSNPGEAIDERFLSQVFDRFYRVDSARRNKGGNHGLGLAIVKAIALMHRGSVFARSQGGRNIFGLLLAAP